MPYYYLDTCIWLNLFKKEKGHANRPHWKTAKELIQTIDRANHKIILSNLVLQELTLKKENLTYILNTFITLYDSIIIYSLTLEDTVLAKKIQFENPSKLSFYDCLHLALAYRANTIFVTRDKNLIKIGNKYLFICTPEQLLK